MKAVGGILDCSGACLAGLKQVFCGPCNLAGGSHEARDEFERTIAFLAKVPLFRNKLPRSELPKVAHALQQRVWQPGTQLVTQGEKGRAFFLIQSGEALVVTHAGPDNEEFKVATLRAGDYFGCHTLTREQRNVATIVAHGPESLVTLSMSRTAFEESGLMSKLPLPKRPGFLVQRQSSSDNHSYCWERRPLPDLPVITENAPEEKAFIKVALRRNVNLRALIEASEDMLDGIAAAAERREVKKGTAVARAGDHGQDLFIVRHGSFDAVVEETHRGGAKSAEVAVSRSTMAERLLRKENFLRSLAHPPHGEHQCKSVHLDGRSLSKGAGVVRPRSDTSIASSPEQTCSRHSKRRRSMGGHFSTLLMPRRSRLQPRQSPLARLGFQSASQNDMERESRRLRSVDPDASTSASATDVEHAGLTSYAATKFSEGESFGELSLLYNARREVTFRASEDSVVYVVGKRHFTAFTSRGGQRVREYCDLLDEVHTLTPLLSSERWELARNAQGLVHFAPGERVLHQSKVREARQWYVVFSGSGVVTQEREMPGGGTSTIKLAELCRGCHFGERSMLRGDDFSQVSVDAGPEGMTCLTFNGENVRVLLEDLFEDTDGAVPSVHCDIEEWCTRKARGWKSASHIDSSRLSDLRQVSVLGRGNYGQVLLTENVVTGKRYALKVVSKGYVVKDRAQQQISWERELLLMLDSPFVVCLHRTFRDQQRVYFLFECALGGSLLEVLHHHSDVLLEDNPRGSSAAFYVACLIAALEHLHERHIVHRDLKPENTLLDSRGYAKICDMGFARFVLGKTNTMAGTPDYMAPEMIDFPHAHDVRVDWWALGVLTYELLAGQPPFEDEGIFNPMARILAIRRSQEKGRLEFPFHFPNVAKGFVTQLLQKDPRKRLGVDGAATVREHAMYRTLDFNFDALHNRALESPYAPPDIGDACGCASEEPGLHLDPSLFQEYEDDGSGWDCNF